MADATFTGTGGQSASAVVRRLIVAAQPTAGDCLLAGQIGRSQIRRRTLAGESADGGSFAPYSEKGPYYLYVNRDAVGTRGAAALKARATASKGRWNALKLGKQANSLSGASIARGAIYGASRTPLGIKFASYAAAKAAHGGDTVNLYGMEQHSHLLDGIIVKAGSATSDPTHEMADMGFSMNEASMLNAVTAYNEPCAEFMIGVYDERAARGRGHNEGTRTLPRRHWLGLNDVDMLIMKGTIVKRQQARIMGRT